MKRIFSSLMACFILIGNALADGIAVNEITIPKGGTATLNIEFNRSEYNYMGFEFKLGLPEGITAQNGSAKLGSRFDGQDHSLGMSALTGGENAGKYQFVSLSLTGAAIPGSNGTLLTVELSADASLEVGATYTATLSSIEFTTTDAQKIVFDNLTFGITIESQGDGRTLLDEASSTMPTNATGVDVRVRRTIFPNEWSTLCLPFDMTTAQVHDSFGSDVKLATFKGWETTEYDDNDNPTAISVRFEGTDAISANVPYIIMMTKGIMEFTVDGVDIDVDEPFVSVGKRARGDFGSFTGSYVPVMIDEDCVFFNNNKLWYSVGNTRMKGYRGYFYFQDVLTDGAGVKLHLDIDGVTSLGDIDGISDVNIPVYDLSGRKINVDTNARIKRGVYILNGKKVAVQ